MSYPNEIIPRSFYNLKLNVEDLLQKYGDNLYVVRVVEGNSDLYKSDDPNFPYKDSIFGRNIISMSVNLLGGKYTTKHLPFLPINEGSLDWNGNSISLENNELEIGIHYKKFEECFGLYAAVKKLHNHVFPYPRIFSSKEKELNEYKERMCANLPNLPKSVRPKIQTEFPINHNFEANLQGYIYLRHSPNSLNYWHMTLEVMTLDSQEPIPTNKKIKGSLKKMLLALLLYYRQVFKNIIPPITEIEEKYYRKDSYA